MNFIQQLIKIYVIQPKKFLVRRALPGWPIRGGAFQVVDGMVVGDSLITPLTVVYEDVQIEAQKPASHWHLVKPLANSSRDIGIPKKPKGFHKVNRGGGKNFRTW